MKKYAKSLVLFVALFLILLNLGNVHAQCINPPCDCDGDGCNKSVAPCTCNVGVDCDCNDSNPAVCLEIACYPDCDNDMQGDDSVAPTMVCEAQCKDSVIKCNGFDYVNNNLDCDDTNEDVYTGAPEKCDGIDNQCLGDSGFGGCDEGCDDDGDDFCDSTMAYVPHNPPTCPAVPDDLNICHFPGDCDDYEGDDAIHPGSICTSPWTTVGHDPCDADHTQCAECIHNSTPAHPVAEACDWADNDCDGEYDEVCPMLPPDLEVWETDTGVQVVGPPPVSMNNPCITIGYNTSCYYDVRSNPAAFKKQGNFTINITWAMPVGNYTTLNITINHDEDQASCECFYATDCWGSSCWNVPGEYGDNPDMEASCCGDDPDEHYVGGTDSVPGHIKFACCDNRDDALNPLPKDECVINGECMDYSPETNDEDSTMCDGRDNDCDGYTDEKCTCDSSKHSCDTNASCPNFLCNDSKGLPKSCWNVGGDSLTGATMCCGNRSTFPNTPGEYYIWNPCDGSDACCDQAGECVLKGVCRNRLPRPETCNFIDDDCDCLVDEDFDWDNDSVSTCAGDCNDTNPAIYPGAPEICGDGIDQDCDGEDTKCAEPEELPLLNLCRLVYDTLYLLFYAAAAITVLLMVIGGIKLMGAEDPEGASNAKSMIRNAIIGLILVSLLLGAAHMFVPECAPLPGSGYNPPFHYAPYPPLVVTIVKPQDREFFEEGETVDYDLRITGGVEPYVYVWDFGDGTPTVTGICNSSVMTWPICRGPTHNYSFSGIYTVKLVVTDRAGERAVDMVDILVGVIIAEIDAPRDEFTEIRGQGIRFNGTVYGGSPPYTCKWESDKDGKIRGPGPLSTPPDKDTFNYALLSENNHLITFTVTDLKGRTAEDSIRVEIVSDAPTVTGAQTCWKDTYGDDQTHFEVDVTPVIPLNDTMISVAVMETGSCWLQKCCLVDVDLGEYKSVSYPGPTPAGTARKFYFDNFCKKARKLQIVVSGTDSFGDPRKWTFCATCDAEHASRYCPGETNPPDYHICNSVELGPCEITL